MNRGMTDREFHLVRALVESLSGISLGYDKKYLAVLPNIVGCSNFEDLCRRAAGPEGGPLQEKILDAIVTSETSWFRDKSLWLALRDSILPGLISPEAGEPARSIRCWSAACAAGQEPYSLAMLIDSLTGRSPGAPTFEILGSDLSNQVLGAARDGVYDRILMDRGLDGPFQQFRRTYFEENGRTSSLKPEIRERVRFERINLVGDLDAQGRFDIILLRNVGIYFSDDIKRSLFDKIANALTPSGFLLLGSAESPLGYSNRFVSREIQRAICYRLEK